MSVQIISFFNFQVHCGHLYNFKKEPKTVTMKLKYLLNNWTTCYSCKNDNKGANTITGIQ